MKKTINYNTNKNTLELSFYFATNDTIFRKLILDEVPFAPLFPNQLSVDLCVIVTYNLDELI